MTGPLPPPSQHLDLDALADALAGERADDGHLSRCASCAEHLAELSEAQARVLRALAALPDPALPEGLELRLAAALDEAAGPARTGTRPAAPAAPTGRGEDSGRTGARDVHRAVPASRPGVTPLPRRVRPAWLPAAAASLVLVLGGGLGYALVSGSGLDAGDATTSAAGGGTESDRSAEESADALSVPAEPESDASARSGAAEPGPAEAAPSEPGTAGTTSAAAPARSATGADYADEVQRAAVLPRVLAGPGPGDVPPEPLSDGPLARLRSPQALDACLSAVTGDAGVAPLALDEAVFRGEPALAVVLPSVAGEVVVHVVGADCAAGDPHELLVVRASRR